jgi:hypothetical protein
LKKLTSQALIGSLKESGMVLTSSTMVNRGNYSPIDADWNYKDVPHLNELHNLVDGIPTAIGSDIITTIFMQRLGPLRLPLTVVNYALNLNSQVYYTSFGPFCLVVDTSWTSISTTSTQVTTTYNLLSNRIFRVVHSIVHRILRRNYEVLMSVDIPMREHRGKLRSVGATFNNDDTGYSFLGTLKIAEDNVSFPSRTDLAVSISIENLAEGRTVLSFDEVQGVVLHREGHQLSIFDKNCPHEGAPLDRSQLSENCLRCPWHGRIIQPLMNVDLRVQVTHQVSRLKLIIASDSLQFEPT